MKIRNAALTAGLVAMGAAAVIFSPGAPASAVANPGPITINVDQLSLTIGSTAASYTAAAAPGCSDGVDDANDADALVDFPADPQCVSATDDSEVKPGQQDRVAPTLTGTVAADGTITIPTTGVKLPIIYVENGSAGGDGTVTATPLAAQTVTGHVNPGAGTLDLKLPLRVTLAAANLQSGCSVGTSSAPINIANLKTSTSGGAPYNPVAGTAVVVDRTYSVPTNSGCGLFAGGPINSALGLPSAAGANVASFAVHLSPALTAGPPDPTTASTLKPTTTTTLKPTTTTSVKPTTTTTVKPTTTTRPTTTTTPKTTTTTAPPLVTSLTAANVIATKSGSIYRVTLSAKLTTPGDVPLRSARLSFTTDNSKFTCRGTTLSTGVATCRLTIRTATVPLPVAYMATYAGDKKHTASASNVVTITYP